MTVIVAGAYDSKSANSKAAKRYEITLLDCVFALNASIAIGRDCLFHVDLHKTRLATSTSLKRQGLL